MADEFCEREQAQRRLPLPYSLALTLRDAGVAAEVICQYPVEQAALDRLYRIGEVKRLAAQKQQRPGALAALARIARATLGSGRQPSPIVSPRTPAVRGARGELEIATE
jgi:hypothetical protein